MCLLFLPRIVFANKTYFQQNSDKIFENVRKTIASFFKFHHQSNTIHQTSLLQISPPPGK